MCEQKSDTTGPGQAGTGEAEQPKHKAGSGIDMGQAMATMMAHCPCGPATQDMMAPKQGPQPEPKAGETRPNDQD